MRTSPAYFWKRTPFIRFFLPFAAGILLQWYYQFPLYACWGLLIVSIGSQAIFSFVSFFKQFKLAWIDGLAIFILFVSLGALVTRYHDVRFQKDWVGKYFTGKESCVVSIDEPLVEKPKSFKANASVRYILHDDNVIKVSGKIVLYLKKDSTAPNLQYGSIILFSNPLQEIRNAGNPGGFDYKTYSLFHGITHQVYLKTNEFAIINGTYRGDIQGCLYLLQTKILNILRHNIEGGRESGLAEALLIGYKDDLDKTLVQSYSNTGVVHIIAISGMHLALIYWLINLLLKPIGNIKKWRWLKPVITIVLLWTFSLLTGASASVIRAAVMLTFIVVAEVFSRKSNIYNTLSASAFFLLCYNPFWLWDVGFQLSYAAVLSIVVFRKPIYNLFYFKNKLVDNIWQLNAVTFAAQILTTPLSLFHFHQFPSYFFLTNFIAVPLSSMIVLGEILLCVTWFITPVATIIGTLLGWLISLMNGYVERVELLPGSLWSGLQINVLQAVFLFLFIAGLSCWLIDRMRNGFIPGLLALFVFFVLRSFSFVKASRQEAIIVYNVSQHSAIDFIEGRHYLFKGDAAIEQDRFLRNFNLEPARTIRRITAARTISNLVVAGNYATIGNIHFLMIDTMCFYHPSTEKIAIDLLVVSGNPKLTIAELTAALKIKQIVFDGSVPFWKLVHWKKDCDSLRISYYATSEKGAFVMNLN